MRMAGEQHEARGAPEIATSGVVRPLSRAARRPCARPSCPAPASARLVFSYATREAWIDPLGEPAPQAYDLCAPHAARTRPPHGWALVDRRPPEERGDPPGEEDDERDTVAVLAAALAEPWPGPAVPGDREDAAATEDPSPVLGPDAACPVDAPSPRPVPAARRRSTPPPASGTPAGDW
jgi:hypothetical protein